MRIIRGNKAKQTVIGSINTFVNFIGVLMNPYQYTDLLME